MHPGAASPRVGFEAAASRFPSLTMRANGGRRTANGGRPGRGPRPPEGQETSGPGVLVDCRRSTRHPVRGRGGAIGEVGSCRSAGVRTDQHQSRGLDTRGCRSYTGCDQPTQPGALPGDVRSHALTLGPGPASSPIRRDPSSTTLRLPNPSSASGFRFWPDPVYRSVSPGRPAIEMPLRRPMSPAPARRRAQAVSVPNAAERSPFFPVIDLSTRNPHDCPPYGPEAWLHADRAAGRHRDHRRPHRPPAAGRPGGPRGRPPRPVH